MVYKSLKNLTPGYLHGRFQYRAKLTKETEGKITTRRASYRLAAGQKTFSYPHRTAKMYNTLFNVIRDTVVPFLKRESF